LNTYFKQSGAYVIDENGNVHPRNPVTNLPLQDREIIHLLNNNVTILKPSKALLKYADKETDITIPDYDLQLRSRTRSKSTTTGFKYVGMHLPVFLQQEYSLLPFFAPPISPLLLAVLAGTSVMTALVGKLGNQGHLLRDFAYSLVINWFAVSLAAFVLPLAAIGLASLSVLSAGAYFAFTGSIPLMIALAPTAVFAMGAVAQLFESNAMININRQ